MDNFSIPSFFSDKDKILNFDYTKITGYIGSSIDHSTTIDNLSPNREKDTLLIGYFKSILLGYNHVYILLLNLLYYLYEEYIFSY